MRIDTHRLTGDEMMASLASRALLADVQDAELQVAIAYDPFSASWWCAIGTSRHLEADSGHEGETVDLAIIAAAEAAGFTTTKGRR